MATFLGVPGQSGQADAQDKDIGESKSINLKGAVSTVEAGVLFLRLAGKHVKGAENIPSPVPVCIPPHSKNSKTKSKGKEKKNGNTVSVLETRDGHKASEDVAHNTGDETPGQPEISEDMDENTLSTFRDLFNMLDQSCTGIITADSLYEELRRVDSEITFSEVEDVLKKIDKDGNGEIDFDEFLFHMTNMGTEGSMEGSDDETKKKLKKRKQMLCNAITQFSIKQTLVDIEKTLKKKSPHVISHYSDGVRLIGLTTRQLERQMKRMQKNAKKNDSPYAKPLQFVHMGAKAIVHKKKIISKVNRSSSRDLQMDMEKREPSQTVVANLSQEIKDTMKLFAEGGPNNGKLPDASLIMKLRQKVGTVKAQLREKDPKKHSDVPRVSINIECCKGSPEDTPQPSLESSAEPTILLTNPRSVKTRPLTAKKRSCQNRGKMSAEVDKVKNSKPEKVVVQHWSSPRIQYSNVPLPCLHLGMKSEKITFDDMHRIRAKAEVKKDAYYHNLKQAEIQNAWDHWDRLVADVILPKKHLENFRKVYNAYSPHREEDAFVVCPWKPGPFLFIRPMQFKVAALSLPNSPDFRSGRSGCSSPRCKSTLDNLVVRPISALQTSLPPSRCSSSMY